MKKQSTELYLYLARRDKKGIRILAKFQGQKQLPTNIDDFSSLQLPVAMHKQLTQTAYDSRMMWESKIESAESFQDLRAKLKARGYTGVPINPQPEFMAGVQSHVVNTSQLPQKTTMLRKN